MSKQPLLVGVTGGMGAGKSVVCKVFQHLGIPVYDADTKAKILMVNHPDLVNEIKNHFGEESYLDDGQLNRNYLADRVFSNADELKRLNGLVHPRVGQDFASWTAENSHHPYVIKEAALMIESGSYKTLDKLVVVTATKDTRVARVLLRDAHRSKADVLAIIDQQLSDSAFKKHADYVISNNTDEPILMRVLELHEKFKALGSQEGV